jgi:predicted nuclease of predicted toxin-antitoxin system
VTSGRPILRVFLDEGVPDSVGKTFSNFGHEVIYLREAVAPGSPDPLVCAAAEANDAILIAFDRDMAALARRQGIGQTRFRKLSLIRFDCRESRAAARCAEAMSLIEQAWMVRAGAKDRRIFIFIGESVIRTHR